MREHSRSEAGLPPGRLGPVVWSMMLLLLAWAWPLGLLGSCRASEFPERECCDPIYPVPEPTSNVPTLPTPTGKSGEYDGARFDNFYVLCNVMIKRRRLWR
ncbi:hypothetical protein QAD02_006879 [Eretmocerus hayati]|uniref:Uncharacterized protein n=1 Tax=Eretmocerus hayati TaxID=131215 RepID=A0ACC2N4G2_9HYME|nr:hypothetical protein QAD02_006879 [Eretmocerus hayati]